MKSRFIILIFLVSTLNSFSQDLPVLNESDLLQPKDIGKQIGWVRVSVDSLFKPVSTDGVYSYYKFSSQWGYNSLLEHSGKFRIEYKKDPKAAGKLLNGCVDMFDTEGHLVARDIFEDGFLVKEWDLYSAGAGHKFPGRLNYVAVFRPGKEEMDWELNAYDPKGVHTSNSHQHISSRGFELVNSYTKIPNTICISDVWYKAGRGYFNYYMNTDTSARTGKASMTIRSVDERREGEGCIYQVVNSGKFNGKRIRMTGYLKSSAITQGWAGLILEIGQPGLTEPVIFDRMSDRKVSGTTGWTKYELVLDVPMDATTITFGLQLNGNGQVWMDDLHLEAVDKTVPVTASPDAQKEETFLKEPANLDFEK
jgi:hypothetical protein